MFERPMIAALIPEAARDSAAVEHFEINKSQAELANLRSAFSGGRYDSVTPGRYARLKVRGAGLMMSDTDMEWQTNQEAIRNAHGRVLVAGLGLGLILRPILAKPDVTAVTVLEINADVIALVEPHVRAWPGGEKLTVLHADARSWTPPRGEKWHTIYFDIWPDICGDNATEITSLKRRFARRLDRSDPRAWMGAWREWDMRRRS